MGGRACCAIRRIYLIWSRGEERRKEASKSGLCHYLSFPRTEFSALTHCACVIILHMRSERLMTIITSSKRLPCCRAKFSPALPPSGSFDIIIPKVSF